MQGLHLTADLLNCQCDGTWLTDAQQLGQHCLALVRCSGLEPVNHLFHTFAATTQGPGGVTATVLLAESHLCVHTWPELRAVTLDVYVCNFGADHSAKAQQLLDALLQRFAPQGVEVHSLLRGKSVVPAAARSRSTADAPVSRAQAS